MREGTNRTCEWCGKTGSVEEEWYQSEKNNQIICGICYQNHLNKSKNENELSNESNISHDEKTQSKSVLKSFGKVISKGAKKISDKTKEYQEERRIRKEEERIEREKIQKINSYKEEILRRFYPAKLKQMCRENRIDLEEKRTRLQRSRSGKLYSKRYVYKFSFDELLDDCVDYISLDDIIAFANRHKIPISDIQSRVQQERVAEEMEKMKESGEYSDDFYLDVVECIQKFRPFKKYDNELPYQIDLARWLQGRFPKTNIEESRESTRPDIIIRDIAIEVKGPTYDKDLQTVSDKCMRYVQYFPRGMVVVLFDVSVYPRRYNDWVRGMENTFPDVVVIKK